jgi:chromosome segregation ATPase
MIENQADEMKHKLELADQKLANRETELQAYKRDNAELRLRNDDLEEDLAKLTSAPKADMEALVELRNKVKSIEASKEVLEEKLKESEERADANEARIKEVIDESSKKDIALGDLRTKLRQVQDEIGKTQERMAEMEELRARLRSYESGDKARELERLKAEHERNSATLERMKVDYEKMRSDLEHTQQTIDGYMGLMENTEKTKAFLMVEENDEMPIREIARALGVSQPIVMKWAEEFQSLGIAWVIDGTTLVHRDAKEKKE